MAYLAGLNPAACGFDSHPLYHSPGVVFERHCLKGERSEVRLGKRSDNGRSANRRCTLVANQAGFRAFGVRLPGLPLPLSGGAASYELGKVCQSLPGDSVTGHWPGAGFLTDASIAQMAERLSCKQGDRVRFLVEAPSPSSSTDEHLFPKEKGPCSNQGRGAGL